MSASALPATATDRTPIERSRPLQVTGRLRAAIDAMVWRGLTRDQAAEAAGIKPHSLYCAFKKSHVLAHYRGELGALRESTRARNFHRLDAIAETSGNDMAKVSAIRGMEQIDHDERTRPLGNVSCGVTIRIVQPAPGSISSAPDVIDVAPSHTIEHQAPEPARDVHGNPIFDPRPRW